jgi:hypothetical protein
MLLLHPSYSTVLGGSQKMDGVGFHFLCLDMYSLNCRAAKKIADKLAKDFQSVLKEFQKAATERETKYAPFVPNEVLSIQIVVS